MLQLIDLLNYLFYISCTVETNVKYAKPLFNKMPISTTMRCPQELQRD